TLVSDRVQQPFKAQVSHAVGIEILRNLINRVRRGDQFRASRRIDPVKAWRNGRWTADAYVYLFRPGGPHHFHDLPARGASNDRIVNQDHPSTLEDALDRVQLDPYAEVANRRLWLDERAADIVIADEAHAQRHTGFLRVAHRRAHAGVGN